MANTQNNEERVMRARIAIRGTVQGVGFRPFIYKLAHRYGLKGWVLNDAEGVQIEVEGNESRLRAFLACIRSEAPPLAVISDVQSTSLPPTGLSSFQIRESPSSGLTQTNVPADIATCRDCNADISSPENRRYSYPFTNCTNCGPRFTIIRRIPYDRPGTTMAGFRMCPACQKEYEDPEDRRFHAQPNACPVCGPHLTLDGAEYGDSEAIRRTADMLREGKILAVKGLGGFHLACDARNTDVVRILRERKGRSGKPFALMCACLDEARSVCDLDVTAEALILTPERPITLAPARPDNGISPLVAPGQTSLGVMIPYTPLHQLLLAESPPTLVMTSGNLSEEPIVHRDEDALERLGHIADHVLAHNRPIHVACDDSVVRVFDGLPMMIRRARGYVPTPIDIHVDAPQALAVGGDLKNTFCLTKGRLALLSQHLGDLENVATLDHYREVVAHFCNFFDVKPEVIAHDLHPDYRSTRFALEEGQVQTLAVQHHHAHVASCMAENRIEGPLIGVAFDGTGYGTDGHIWGSEFLIADYSDFRRAAHLEYLPLPGGDAAVRRPGRMALSHLLHTFGPEGQQLGTELIRGLAPAEANAVSVQIDRMLNSPLTSSMGRLFDAVSALIGVCLEVTYEGQAAIELESSADREAKEVYPYGLTKNELGEIEIDVRAMITEIVENIGSRVPAAAIAGRFHLTVADMVAAVCDAIRNETGLSRVALSGGVFQNILLLEMALRSLNERGFEVFRQTTVPCNDGGLSLGQAAVAARRYAR